VYKKDVPKKTKISLCLYFLKLNYFCHLYLKMNQSLVHPKTGKKKALTLNISFSNSSLGEWFSIEHHEPKAK